MKIPRLALAAACLFVLAACGNKGPLILPQKPQTVPVQDPLPAPAEPADSVPKPVPPTGAGTPR